MQAHQLVGCGPFAPNLTFRGRRRRRNRCRRRHRCRQIDDGVRHLPVGNELKRLAGDAGLSASMRAPVVKQTLGNAVTPSNLGDRPAAPVDLGQQCHLIRLAIPTTPFRPDNLDVGHHEAPSGLQKEAAAFILCGRVYRNAAQAGRVPLCRCFSSCSTSFATNERCRSILVGRPWRHSFSINAGRR